MADNTLLNAGTGGDLARTIDRSGSGPKTGVVVLDVGSGASESLVSGAVPTIPLKTLFTMTSAGLTIVTTNYTAADQMGTQMTGAAAVRQASGLSVILGAICVSNAGATPNAPFDLELYTASVTPAADNAVSAYSDADRDKLTGVLQFPAFQFSNAANGWGYSYLPVPVPVSAAATSIFGNLTARGAINFFTAVGDLNFTLFGLYLS